ncbi:MAG: metallophosphoesterase [Bacteriovoracaceae bacterium]
MKFLQKSKGKKLVLVISDLHLGAGAYFEGKKNFLEDFHYDEELIEFLNYFASYHTKYNEVELIINGDFLDFLAVPYVRFFDDEFWSEEASLKKLDIVLEAHQEVFSALNNFLKASKKNSVCYIIGNHDAEFIFSSMRERFERIFDNEVLGRFKFLTEHDGQYRPHKGIVISHGHEYEVAHHFDLEESIAVDDKGRKFFIPPWGSYYVVRVINKFKQQRHHINAVRPIQKFLINGIIYDTLFTIRFMLANFFYFVMVRFINVYKTRKKTQGLWQSMREELELFKNYEELVEDFFRDDKEAQVLVVGHTHDPIIRQFEDGHIFINTGTWTKMYNLDFGKGAGGANLTFAAIEVKDNDEISPALLNWRGTNSLPYSDFQ